MIMNSSSSASGAHVPASQPQRSSSPDGSDDGDLAQKKTPVRKRTKTGCLTCRKRRIKCDEGKPICNNCVRSKRQCEGYNQRVIFKDPLGAFGSASYGPIHYAQSSPEALVREQQLSAAQQRSSSSSLQIIAPKPPAYHSFMTHQFSHFHPGQSGPVPPAPSNLPPTSVGPQPSKFTFLPSTTADAFTQGQASRGPQRTAPDGSSRVPTVVPPYQQRTQPKKNGTLVQLEPTDAEQEVNWDYDYPDDDASMAESEDEYPLANDDLQLSQRGLGMAVSSTFDQKYQMFGTHVRTFSTYGAETVLATYDPSPINSPLTDRHIAAVFWHFINVTGPSMSLYERHPLDPANTFQGQAIHTKQQNIWAYAFPVMAFSHPALLQAMLALGSLQIAKLQRVPPTASLKHYHLALRRIAKNVSRPARRTQIANLAATLLLAFYEVWNSDHDKWCRHLLGARWIIKEIPLSEMTRAVMAIKMQKRRDEMERLYGNYGEYPATEDTGYLYKDWDLMDISLLSTILGYQVSYDELGMLPEELSSYPRSKNFHTEKDIEKYENLSDLFWWYGKMDVYQSILGGTRPSLELHKWMQCPPRAPIGRLDAIYGTYDYVTLLLARLAHFVARDLARKREALATKGSGSVWPPPGMFTGMMPVSDHVTPPMGFSPPREDASPSDGGPIDIDLSTRTVEACQEWEQIQQGFEELKAHFGPDFDPLPSDVYPTHDTPFGPAAHFRTYSIAGIWMNYYMGLIVLHRAHPTMPPVAMLAAGMTAKTTMPWAFEIGRISAGMEENITRRTVVSTLVGAALIESSFSLFVAGVQYQVDAQRHWLIRRLRASARLTGWQSAHQIADGCQSAWLKAAKLGRGPPYVAEPYVDDDENASEVRQRHAERRRQPKPPDHGPPGLSWIWGNPRRLDRRIMEDPAGNAVRPTGTDEGGKKKIVLAKGEKAFYAMGLLTVEQDLEKLDLDSGDPDDSKK
ncbi:hypothetical protein F5Y16DRAFT_412894 [Xylariaceae sp. FL0255]|nr:hypothetical protein F5Y16DRAFT_412894 [Xylariaceae sp. FL0255]